MSIVCYDSENNELKQLYQWDINQTITVSGVTTAPFPIFHFCNRSSKEAVVVTPAVKGDFLEVNIPNILLQKNETIIIYLYEITDDDGSKTVHTIHIPVVPRAKPNDYEYVDNIEYPSYAILSARMSALLAIITNQTTSDMAEVIDVRIGHDGVVYDTAGDAVRALGEEITLVKEELEKYIDAKAVDGLYYEDSMLYLTSNGELVSDPVEIVSGGGGGGSGTSSIVRVTNQNDSTVLSASSGSPVILKFNFTSIEDEVPTGNGSCRITIGGITKANFSVVQGLNTFDVSSYLSVGSNSVRVTCTDVYGNSRSIVYTVTLIELEITSTFDDTVTYNGEITFKYTPYGLIEKVVHFLIDETEVDTITVTSSGKQSTKIFEAMDHGVHRLEVYMTATLEGNNIESNRLVYDIMCTESGNVTAFIASPFTQTQISQGMQLSIPYTVYDPEALACDINLNIYTLNSGVKTIYSTQSITVDRLRRTWNTRRYPVGSVYFEIEYSKKSISKVHNLTVTEAEIDVEPATNDLEMSLSSAGRSNSEAEPNVWTDGNVVTTFTNVNWNTTGWIEDDNGDVALRLNGDAKAVVEFQPFNNDLRIYGKTIEIEFEIKDVNNRDAVVIDCMSGGIGIQATADRAFLQSELSSVECRYKDEEKVRVSFVIEGRNEYRMMSVYLNGVLSGAKQYVTNDNFQQITPVNITIGSPYCSIDVYSIRSYNTALSAMDIKGNYIAEIADVSKKVEVWNNNNIYDEYNNLSYEMLKPKIPVMTIIGTLPTSTVNKRTVTIRYEDPNDPTMNFTDTCTIDVQGTSSQYYVRKNWKLKFGQEHQHAADMIPTKVFCMKVDYAEATGTHNTQNANLIHTLYSEPIPPQSDDERVRTTIYGFPCVIFHQSNEFADPVFYGKANFNYDKGSENAFGFTEAYDVECWEFLNNTSDVCNFRAPLPENWTDDFEARYPEDSTDVTRLSAMIQWVYDTREDLTRFKAEFENHFQLHYMLVYYVYSFLMLMVDQRAKNMMFTYWGGIDKWMPYFYDNDTCLGINNEGQLVFDYYHEDTDQLEGANVYNGQNSTLWNNFRIAFADEIAETYRTLRSSGKITYDRLCEYFIDSGSDCWSESIYNEDSDFKYISMLRSDGDATNLYQVRGDGEQHFKYFIKNRLDYCDGKWYAEAYADDYISFRIYTPTDENGNPRTDLVVPSSADITITPFSNMYAGVRYKANGTLQQQRVNKNETVVFEAPDETFNDTETAIYGASNISSLGDLSPLYLGSVNVSKAAKLVELNVGSAIEGYDNPNLVDISIGTNRLLKKLDIRNCSGLSESVNLSGCPNVEEIYAEGSKITGIELCDGGTVKVMHLPETIRNLTLSNQIYVEDFTMAGYDELKTLRIENCPTIDEVAILQGATNIERARLTGVNWSFDDVSFLQSLYGIAGIDETGANTDFIHISGRCHIVSLDGAQMAEIMEKYPYLTITYDNLTTQLIFMSEDGLTELGRQTINNGGNGEWTGTTPTKTSTAQYTYSFDGWSRSVGGSLDTNALIAVEADRYVYAHFAATIRSYTVSFYNGTTLLYTTIVQYGTTATYNGIDTATLQKTGVDDPENYQFRMWSPSPTNITQDTTCSAMFQYLGAIQQSWEEISQISSEGLAQNYFSLGDLKEITLQGVCGTVSLNTDCYVCIIGFDHNAEIEGYGITFMGFKIKDDASSYNRAWGALIDEKYGSVGTTSSSEIFNGYCMFQAYASNSSASTTISQNGRYSTSGSNGGGGTRWDNCDLRYIILGSTDSPPRGFRTNAKGTRYYGNSPSDECATNPVPDSLMSCLPSDLRNVMKPLNKWSYTYDLGATTVDYLPLFSTFEVGGNATYSICTDENQQMYEYFEIESVLTGIKNLISPTTENISVWTRSNGRIYSSAGATLVGVTYALNTYGKDGSSRLDLVYANASRGIMVHFLV